MVVLGLGVCKDGEAFSGENRIGIWRIEIWFGHTAYLKETNKNPHKIQRINKQKHFPKRKYAKRERITKYQSHHSIPLTKIPLVESNGHLSFASLV